MESMMELSRYLDAESATESSMMGGADHVAQLPITFMMTPDLRITMRDEDLTSIMPGDILVNFVAEGDLDFQGTTSRSILARAGVELLEEFHHRRPDGIQAGDICVTPSYGLGCRAVFHTGCIAFEQTSAPEDPLQFTEQPIWEVMRMADVWGAKRIVFPIFALDGALLQIIPDLVSSAARRIAETGHSLLEICVIIYKNTNLFQIVSKEFEFHFDQPIQESMKPEMSQPIIITHSLQVQLQFSPVQLPEADVYVTFADVNESQPEAGECIFSEHSCETAEKANAADMAINNMQQGIIIGTCNNLLPPALILHLGFSSLYNPDQFYEKSDILEDMVKLSFDIADSKAASTVVFPLDAACLKGFPCRPIVEMVLSVIQKKPPHLYKNLRTITLVIDNDVPSYLTMAKLFMMFGFVYSVEIAIPEGSTWSHVRNTDPDYNTVADRFLAEMQPNVSYLRIFRNENNSLLERYKEKLQEVINRGDAGEIVERMLWHGSTKENVEKICREGFDPALARRAIYGVGIYFAMWSGVSQEYSIPDPDGIRCMILAKVITGRFCKSETGVIPPGYDTAVDTTHDPRIFVCADAHKMFPAYILVYRV